MSTFAQRYILQKQEKALEELSFLAESPAIFAKILKDWTAYNEKMRGQAQPAATQATPTQAAPRIDSLQMESHQRTPSDFKALSKQHYAASKFHTEAAKKAMGNNDGQSFHHHIKAAEHHATCAKLAVAGAKSPEDATKTSGEYNSVRYKAAQYSHRAAVATPSTVH